MFKLVCTQCVPRFSPYNLYIHLITCVPLHGVIYITSWQTSQQKQSKDRLIKAAHKSAPSTMIKGKTCRSAMKPALTVMHARVLAGGEITRPMKSCGLSRKPWRVAELKVIVSLFTQWWRRWELCRLLHPFLSGEQSAPRLRS